MTGTDVATTRAGLLPARVQQPGLGAQRPAETDLRSLVLAPGSAKRTLELLDSRWAGATLDGSSAEDYNQRNQRSTGTAALPVGAWAGLTGHPAGVPGLAGRLGDILRGACLSDRLRCAAPWRLPSAVALLFWSFWGDSGGACPAAAGWHVTVLGDSRCAT